MHSSSVPSASVRMPTAPNGVGITASKRRSSASGTSLPRVA